MGNISQTPFIPAPFVLAVPGYESVAVNATAITAGAAFFNGIKLDATVTVVQMRINISGSPTGNIDMGIYDATGTNGAPNNLLGHTGAIAATTGLFTKSLTANLVLPPGQYWLALLDTVADSIFGRLTTASGLPVVMRTTATNLTVLPSTVGTVADNANEFGIIALLQNSFS